MATLNGRLGDMTAVLLALRFMLELALLAALGVIGWNAFDNTILSVIAAIALVVVAAAAWGALLSPKRRLDVPLALRVVIELCLFIAASAGLWATGYAGAGLALLGGEVVVIVALGLLGLPPGTHVDPRPVNTGPLA